MRFIRNEKVLLSHGEVELRKEALDIVDTALSNTDPYERVKKLVSFDGNEVRVGNEKFAVKGKIYVIGAGKASYHPVKALEDILGDAIDEGVLVCKYGQEGNLNRCRMLHASHPLPDENGILASQLIMELAEKTQPGDIVFCCITGGSTSLLPLPHSDITLEDLRETYRQLLRCAANIVEMNAVRKHLCRIKGGRLAEAINEGATIINLTISDVIGDMLDYITCPTVPDTSTLDDARSTITKYSLWDKLPDTVVRYLREAGEEDETPKQLNGHRIVNHILLHEDEACQAALNRAKELGYNAMILSSMFEGESKEAGAFFASIGKEVSEFGRPLAKPCAIIGGGEMTMKIDRKDPGIGGPSQQFVLSAATWLEGWKGIVIVGIDTDGTDGVSDYAGGIVDGYTAIRAREAGINIYDYMARFDDTNALLALDDAIFTGATGNNINDLKLMLVK